MVLVLAGVLSPGVAEAARAVAATEACEDGCGGCPSDEPQGLGCCGALLVTCGCACNGAAPVVSAALRAGDGIEAPFFTELAEPLPPALDDPQGEIFHPPAI